MPVCGDGNWVCSVGVGGEWRRGGSEAEEGGGRGESLESSVRREEGVTMGGDEGEGACRKGRDS